MWKTDAMKFDMKKADNYEKYARKAVFGYDQLFNLVLSFIAEDKDEHKNVLVVGCGTGMELTTFGNHMPNWTITGVDPSEEMIKISRNKIDQNNLNDRVKLIHGFVENISGKEKYDVATMVFVLRFIANYNMKKMFLMNIAKLLKPGAHLLIVDQYSDSDKDHFDSMFKSWRNFMKLSGAPAELVNKIAVQTIEYAFINEYDLQKLLFESGYGKIKRFYSSFIHGGWIVQK